ncbi:MFS transporter [Tardiphaga robiniae]|uniref:MFS transporter n=1 Tax=Tardiphaga robiniae TaxID=943830 RepID=UPI00286C9E28|nr:MFS transporter [Tardiphaga robiniae]
MADSRVVESGPVSAGRVTSRPLVAVGAVMLGSFLASFDTRLFSLALPDLRGAMGMSSDEGAWFNTAGTAPQILIAPAVAWLATAFGVRRVLGIPSLVYAVVCILMPLIRDYDTLLVLNIVHGFLLGIFVPATLLVIIRVLPMQWWVPALAIYCIRVGFSMNSGVALVGFYLDHVGWEWIYWQGAIVAPLMALMVHLGSPPEPVNEELVRDADWGGMLLLGCGMAMMYAGLDQGNRLDWLNSGTVVSLLTCGGALTVGFFVNEAIVDKPWAHANVLLSRNIGLVLLTVLLFTLTSLSNSSLAPGFLTNIAQLRLDESGPLFLAFATLPMLVFVPLSIYLVEKHDVRIVLVIGIAAFAAAGLLGTRLTHDWSLSDFIPMVLLQSLGQSFALLAAVMFTLANSNPARSTAFAAYIQVMRLFGAEFGVSLMATWLRTQEQVSSNLLGLNLARGDADANHVLAQMAARFVAHGASSAQARATSTLASAVQREANTLAYIDGFWLTAWIAIAALVCVGLMRAAPIGPFSPKSDLP